MKVLAHFLVLVILIASCKDESTGPEDNICSFVNPHLAQGQGLGLNIPNCSYSDVYVSNVQRISPYGVVSSFNFNISCSSSGKTYTGRIYDVEYSDQWIPVAYKLEINGKNCGRMNM